MELRIAVVGDFEATFWPHTATNDALGHTARVLAVALDAVWVPTDRVVPGPAATLDRFDGLWIGPGSPYRDIEGALAAIRFARERDWPLVAT
jgi:CTP synthase (UTP-ammonia lyase)